MESISQTLAQRQSCLVRSVSQPVASIEEAGSNTAKSIEAVPSQIDDLIDNKMYRNKFRKLIREGHLQDLLELVEIAHTKDKPSHWFATATAKKSWDKTLAFLAKAREIARTAAEVVKRLAVPVGHLKAVYKACWTLRSTALRHAITAAETGRDPFKLFCWLCWKSPSRP